MADCFSFDAEYGLAVEVLPAGTRFVSQDRDSDVLGKHAIHVTDLDLAVAIEGTKEQLVALLENALHRAWSLPDDEQEKEEG